VDLPSFIASVSKRVAEHLCLHHELHEYDLDEDSSKAYVSSCFATLRLCVYIPKSSDSDGIEQFGGLFQMITDIWLLLAVILGGMVNTLPSIDSKSVVNKVFDFKYL